MPLRVTNSGRAALCGFDWLGYLSLLFPWIFSTWKMLWSSDVKDWLLVSCCLTMLSLSMLERGWGQTSLRASQVLRWAIFFWADSITWLVKMCKGLWGLTIICGPESLEIILALRKTVSGGYLAFVGLIVLFAFWICLIKKGLQLNLSKILHSRLKFLFSFLAVAF